MGLVPVKDGDELKSYYKYYAAGIAPNTQEDFVYLEKGAVKPVGTGIEFANRNDAISEKVEKYESGVYPLEGGGYLTLSKIPVPDITADMMWWWSAWHCLDPLRYACWDPEDHFDIQVTDEDRTRVLDPNVPIKEKTWGTTQLVTEAIGDAPAEPVHIHILKPSDIGMDMSLIGTKNCKYLSVANSELGPMRITILGILADTDAGSEFRELFYFGYAVDDGKDICVLPKGEIEPVKGAALGAFMHTRKEYRNLNIVLPQIYKENKDIW